MPTKITGFDRFMEKLNRKKRQANDSQPKPVAPAAKKNSAKK